MSGYTDFRLEEFSDVGIWVDTSQCLHVDLSAFRWLRQWLSDDETWHLLYAIDPSRAVRLGSLISLYQQEDPQAFQWYQ